MAKTLSKTGITTTNTIEAWHVTQSVDALTGTDAYDITISGSLNVDGPVSGSFTGSFTGTASYATTASYSLNNFQEVLDNGSSATISEVFDLTVNENITINSPADTATLTGDEAKLSGSNNTTIVGNSVNITGKTNLVGAFTASGDISSSGILYSTQYKVDGVTFIDTGGGSIFLGSASTPTLTRGNYTFLNPITASSDISSSGTITGLSGSFSHLRGNSPITVTSPIISQLNNTKVVEVENSSSFPTPVGTQITLEENTTYIIRGNVNMSDTLFASGSGISLIGLDRNLDTLTYTSSSTFLTVNNSDFTIRDLKFSATNTSSLLISGSNYTSGSFNQGRNKIFEIVNTQFRNCGNVADFKGYDLIDFSNTLFFYVQAPTIGVRFQDTSKVEISSCEFIRWYDETSIPSPSGYSTAPMIQLRDTGSEGAGFGAVNINGCIIHPQVQQDGIRIATGSTTGFGTISSNAFININLTTGSVFYPTNVQDLPDYSQTATYNYDVYANQGILNSTSGIIYTVSNNTQVTTLSSTTPTIIDLNVSAVDQASSRFTLDTSTGKITYTGTKQIYVSFHITLSFLKQDKGTDDYTFYIAKGTSTSSAAEITASGVELPDLDDIGGSVTLVYGILVNNGDFFEPWVESSSGDDILVTDIKFLIRE